MPMERDKAYDQSRSACSRSSQRSIPPAGTASFRSTLQLLHAHSSHISKAHPQSEPSVPPAQPPDSGQANSHLLAFAADPAAGPRR